MSQVGGEARQRLRGEISRASTSRSSAPAPSASSSASRRNTAATSTPSTRSSPPTCRICSTGRGKGWLAPYVPEDVATLARPTQRDPDGYYATNRATLSVIGYNTKLVKPEDAPKSLCRPARPQMEGQDRQGASRLQRHDHDRDLRAQSRRSAGIISRSSASSRSCRCSPRPSRRRSWRRASAR